MAGKYASSGIFLAAAQAGYQNEIARTSSIDTSLSISLPIVAAYFFTAVQRSSLSQAFEEAVEADTPGAVLLFLAYIGMLIGAALSFAFMVRSALPNKYTTIDLKEWNGPRLSMTELEYSAALATQYLDVTEMIAKTNDSRAVGLAWGWFFGAVSLICYVLHVLFAR